MKMRPIQLPAFVMLAASLAWCAMGCAVVNKEKRSLTMWMDKNAAPENKVARAALLPVAVPVGVATLTIDGTVINTVRGVPEAFDKTNDFALFIGKKRPYRLRNFARDVWVSPVQAVVYPVVFAANLFYYVMDA